VFGIVCDVSAEAGRVDLVDAVVKFGEYFEYVVGGEFENVW
jgi:hypothetical protein